MMQKNSLIIILCTLLISCKIIEYKDYHDDKRTMVHYTGKQIVLGKDSLFLGVWNEYDSEGTLILKTRFKKREGSWLVHGKVKEYYQGQFSKMYRARKGKIVGVEKSYFNGVLSSAIHYDKNGRMKGTAKYYYTNGKIKEKGTYAGYADAIRIDGSIDSSFHNYSIKKGVWTIYYPEGNIKLRGRYDKNIMLQRDSILYDHGNGLIEKSIYITPHYFKHGKWELSDSLTGKKRIVCFEMDKVIDCSQMQH